MAPRQSGSARVSLVIPCFNGGPYLSEALASARGQLRPADEIVLVDDGSTDGSAAAAAADGGIHYHRQNREGMSAARNRGVALARGDVIAFLDADDLWTAGSLALRLALLNDVAEPDYVFGAVDQFYSPDLPAAKRAALSASSQIAGRLAGAMLIRRAAWERVGPLDPSLKAGEMVDWVARAAARKLVSRATNEIVLQRRIHAANSVHQHDDYRADHLRALRNAVRLKQASSC
ncbi:glycosyltransferase family 2 protein [Sphingosinicella rhizophila]|uniref:Glycosyltransferase family A protein n=1 Tax=Sphingosinicella rhizophila TaxID=3050082 RepID=A0ABU3QAP6_9SPHN|nr:glycosyltransferase family A protein [Sphingosinicella sp. GR2756]MDT9600474.1 glycosyltransferase family A protein [Sphingosinicella sp. GR2756]